MQASTTTAQAETIGMNDEEVLDLGAVIGDQPDDLVGRERRVSVRAYNYWASLLNGRAFPSVADLNATDIEAFRDTSILLDFSKDINNPVLRYVGKLLRDECGLSLSALKPEDVPGRSLLSRLTDHYLEIIANRAPIGFEAEFHNLRGHLSMYRGILMPLSDDGETINFIYGVISWKEVVAANVALAPAAVSQADESGGSVEDDEDDAFLLGTSEAPTVNQDAEPFDLSIPADDADDTLDLREADEEILALAPFSAGDIDPASALADLLSDARDAAEAVATSEGRSRSALYNALQRAYAFSHAATANPEAYAEVLADAGLIHQERAPFTPVVKLVFGATYDKTRLTEYAATLSYATRESIDPQALQTMLENTDGGIKAIVQAERAERARAKGNQRIDKAAHARDRLRLAQPMGSVAVPEGFNLESEYCLLVGRRTPGGDRVDIVAIAAEPDTFVNTILRRLPKR